MKLKQLALNLAEQVRNLQLWLAAVESSSNYDYSIEEMKIRAEYSELCRQIEEAING